MCAPRDGIRKSSTLPDVLSPYNGKGWRLTVALLYLKKLVGSAGLEPATLRLEVGSNDFYKHMRTIDISFVVRLLRRKPTTPEYA